MIYSFFNTQQGGFQNNHLNSRLIRHGNGFMEEWMSKFFIVAEITGSVNFRYPISKSKCTRLIIKIPIGTDANQGLYNYFAVRQGAMGKLAKPVCTRQPSQALQQNRTYEVIVLMYNVHMNVHVW